jgi:hypothetical protein
VHVRSSRRRPALCLKRQANSGSSGGARIADGCEEVFTLQERFDHDLRMNTVPLWAVPFALLVFIAVVACGARYIEHRSGQDWSTAPINIRLTVWWLDSSRGLATAACIAYGLMLVLLAIGGGFTTESGVRAVETVVRHADQWSRLAERIRLSVVFPTMIASALLFWLTIVWPRLRMARALVELNREARRLDDLRSLRDWYVATGTFDKTLEAIEEHIQAEERRQPSRLSSAPQESLLLRLAAWLIRARGSTPVRSASEVLTSASLGLFFLSLVALEPGVIGGALALRAVEIQLKGPSGPALLAAGESTMGLPHRLASVDGNALDQASRRVAEDIRSAVRREAHGLRRAPSRMDSLYSRYGAGRGVIRDPSPPNWSLPDPPYPFSDPSWPGAGPQPAGPQTDGPGPDRSRRDGPRSGPHRAGVPPHRPGSAPLMSAARSPLEQRIFENLRDRVQRSPETGSLVDYLGIRQAPAISPTVLSEDLIDGASPHVEEFFRVYTGNSIFAKVASKTLGRVVQQWLEHGLDALLSGALQSADLDYRAEWRAYVDKRLAIAGKHGCPITQRVFDSLVAKRKNPLRLYTDDVETKRWLAEKGVSGIFLPPLIFDAGRWTNRAQRLPDSQGRVWLEKDPQCVIDVP